MNNNMENIEYNTQTGETTVIPFTSEQIAEVQARKDALQKQQNELEAELQEQENAKASALAKLAALGLTQDEVTALIG